MNEDDHSNVRDELTAFLDGELPEARRRAVAAHLRGCVACRGEVRRLEGLERLLVTHPPSTQPTTDFERRFAVAFRREVALRHGRIPSPAARRRAIQRWVRPMWVPLSAAAIAAGATIVFWPDTRPQSAIVAEAIHASETVPSEAPIVPAVAEEMIQPETEMPTIDAMPTFLTVPRSTSRTSRGFSLVAEPGLALVDGAVVVPAAVPKAMDSETLAQ